MTKVLLCLHILAVIIAIGPVTVAASMFPAAARRGEPDTVRTLHRICRTYSLVGIAVPVFGFAVAGTIGILGRPWLLASIALTAVAAAVLIFLVLPGQDAMLDTASARNDGNVATKATGRLAMYTGIFNLLWVAVAVLMVIHPGAPKGA